ncbi:Predicted arabinose efflux permease, MFS family [Granulicella pectinivorans]|uniref:Predicted arabinose efflux permease, MFS family n=1 Tax=Granulicella pectinivorans TaxID=474950 RepID=A0A1I6LA56_9BACT|nr:MFS transporter [Granulicella pectinivorans]SFS00337.1 Predicted arabinose efflux permease, MFS family [Granulicella pectinivorans]
MPLTQPTGRFDWWRQSTSHARKALAAASLGWLLDAFDVMLYALVLASLILDLGMSKQTAGILGSITLIAAAFGGLLFGLIADRFGRTRALVWSVLIYAVFTAACGFAHTVVELAIFRILLGIGVGGEWASGAALVSETWPAEHRGKALGLMQSCWAIGYALAALTAGIILPWKGWRPVFFVGLIPALFTLFIRRNVPEPDAWIHQRRLTNRNPHAIAGFKHLFTPDLRWTTAAVTLMNAFCLFAWWGFNLWVPAYLSLPAARGGLGLSAHAMSYTVIAMQGGMWFGYISFGFLADALGRKRCYIVFLITAAALMFLYGHLHTPLLLLILGPFLAFFGTGYFTGFAAVTSEIFETGIRATGMGFAYNTGRIASAIAPFAVGSMAQQHGFGAAFGVAGLAFLAAACCWIWIPETKGRAIAA